MLSYKWGYNLDILHLINMNIATFITFLTTFNMIKGPWRFEKSKSEYT